ncbi:hypothetical protein BJV74DRAFT_799689 [Russula compacta]|nr:hypothetical protein BJV74DRAFT_799689 [Russula compacta]
MLTSPTSDSQTPTPTATATTSATPPSALRQVSSILIPKGNVCFSSSPGGTIFRQEFPLPLTVPHKPHPVFPCPTLPTIVDLILAAIHHQEKAASQELPGVWLLTKEEYCIMFPKEFIAWYTDKQAQKGYKDLPVWLPQDLLARYGPLPKNPENIQPWDPIHIANGDRCNSKEGLSPSLSLAMLQAEEPSASPEPIPIPPPCQLVVIPKEDAIDLTNSDNEGLTNPTEIPDEEDPLPLDHPREEWEQYSPRLHGNTFLLTIDGSPQEAKYIQYELGWMSDNPAISGTMGWDLPIES